ncbi:MAG: type II secretion system protein GspM [Pseudomonadota bacterium]
MARQLSEQHQRWIALGLLGLVVMLFVSSVVLPIAGKIQDNRDTLENLEFRLQRYKKIIRGKDALLARAEEVKQQISAENYFISREKVSLAQADLQQMVKDAIDKAGAELASTQVIEGGESDTLPRIAIRIRFSGNIEALREVLHGIESARPLLVIENLNLRPIAGKRDRRTRRILPSDKLSVSLEIAGFLRANKL